MSVNGRRHRPRKGRSQPSPKSSKYVLTGNPFAAYERRVNKGFRHELRLYRAFIERCHDWPSWLLGIRHGTEEEDRHGIDFVFETIDAGDLLLQVKSSAQKAIQFREGERQYRRNRWIEVHVVTLDDRKPDIYRDALKRLADLRLERIKQVGRSFRPRPLQDTTPASEEADAAE